MYREFVKITPLGLILRHIEMKSTMFFSYILRLSHDIATRSDTISHIMIDLMQSLVSIHYVCNGYLSREQIKREIYKS